VTTFHTNGVEAGTKARAAPVAAFESEIHEIGSVLSIRLRGELDLSVVDEVRAALEEPLRGPGRVTVLDVGGITFCDSTGLALLMRTKQAIEGVGGRLLIARVSRTLLRLLEASGLGSFFDYLDGQLVQATCPVCDAGMPRDATACPACGAV
jgi:anti-sigma B factor antagonist